MRLRELGPAFLIASAAVLAPRAAAAQGSDYEADVRFAIEQIETQCAELLRVKDIDWPKVSKPFLKEAAEVQSDSQHLVLLKRLLARLEDGHAAVQPLERGQDVKWPEEPERTGAGMAWCKSGKKILVKNVWNVAQEMG